jgi:hypothetical protein
LILWLVEMLVLESERVIRDLVGAIVFGGLVFYVVVCALARQGDLEMEIGVVCVALTL